MALGLVLFGLEVATGAVTLTAVRLWTGFSTLFTGDESLVSGPRYLIGIVLAFAGVTLYVVLLWADEAVRRITEGGVVCPNCGTQTKRVRRQRRHRDARAHPGGERDAPPLRALRLEGPRHLTPTGIHPTE